MTMLLKWFPRTPTTASSLGQTVCPLADTTIRLWHVGKHHFGGEEAGLERPRLETFSLKVKG